MKKKSIRKLAFAGMGIIAVLGCGSLVWLNVRHRPVIYHDYTFAHQSKLPPCPSDDPLGLRSANPCQPPAPKQGAPPCPANDPVGLNTTQPCAPLPPR